MTDVDLLPDLAARSLGGGVVFATDELFAASDHLVHDQAPVYNPHSFGPKGQIYDGWESRRRRTPGHDHAIVRLGVPGIVRGVVVDTAFFTGNYPPEVSVEGCGVEGHPAPDELAVASWFTLVPRSPVARRSGAWMPRTNCCGNLPDCLQPGRWSTPLPGSAMQRRAPGFQMRQAKCGSMRKVCAAA